MAVTKTARFALNRWDSGSDPFNRLLADSDNLQIETLGAVFRTGADANKGDASSSVHVRSFYYSTDTTTLYFSDGTNWVTLGDPGEAADISTITTGTAASAGSSSTSGGVTVREFALANHVHAVGTPGTPANVGTAASPGTTSGGTPASDNHVHRLGNGSIDNSSLFASGVVTASALATDSVTTVKIQNLNVTNDKIAANAITRDKLASGLDVLQSFSNESARLSGIPSPVEGRFTYLQNRNVLSFYTGTEWLDVVSGTPLLGSNTQIYGGDAFSF